MEQPSFKMVLQNLYHGRKPSIDIHSLAIEWAFAGVVQPCTSAFLCQHTAESY